MSTEVATINQDELDAFAAQAGAEQSSGNFTPQLRINYDDEDADGKEIKPGLFFVTGQDKAVYAKTVKFRPLTHHFQWTKYDDVAKKVTNRTRFVTTLRGTDEPRDELGTLKCGKPASKDLKANPALAKKYEDVTCYRTVHGIVSYEGVDADGNPGVVENVPCALRLKGANFSPFEEEYFGKLGKGRVWDHSINIYTKKEKNGASTYYVLHFDDVDFSVKEQFTVEMFNVAKELQTRITDTNKEIDTKYYNALHGAKEDLKAINALSLADDMEDDIPF